VHHENRLDQIGWRELVLPYEAADSGGAAAAAWPL
jgi:hypothetical protein